MKSEKNESGSILNKIIDREVTRQGQFTHREINLNAVSDLQVMSVVCARAACLAVAKAVVEECAKAVSHSLFDAEGRLIPVTRIRSLLTEARAAGGEEK